VIGEYIKTSKNAMVADIYEKMGFVRTGEYTFTADTNKFIKNKNYIT
jgi:predicted enzyme involved in methoxymalonyl-ACP biosynthesis